MTTSGRRLTIRSGFAVFPVILGLGLLFPMLLGLVGTLLPALGWLPVLGFREWSIVPLQTLWQHPSFPRALGQSLLSGWFAPVLALFVVLALLGFGWQGRVLRWLRTSLSTLLAIPHAAFALGLLLLLGPSGWVVRGLSPALTGWVVPPSWAPGTLSLTLTLALKEIPFLLLMALSGLQQLKVDPMLRAGRAMGYSQWVAWWRLIVPRLLPMLRLPMFAVMAYSLSVVDIALIVGPSAPGTLAVLIDRWFHLPDVAWRLPASAGAMLLLLITGLSLTLWWGLEHLWRYYLIRQASTGQRRSYLEWLRRPVLSIGVFVLISALGAFLVLLVWSFSFRWSFPLPWPEVTSLASWHRAWPRLQPALLTTLITGLVAAFVSLVLVLGTLEYLVQKSRHSLWRGLPAWLLLPLLVPQIAFLFGVQVWLVGLAWDGQWWTLLWSHLLYVVPYMYLSLVAPYRHFDQRYMQQARALGRSYWRALWFVKWPMLLRPILYALAIGFAVSLAQYLPTLYVGAGRFSTITTEVVALGISADRRVLGVYAVLQWLLPMLIFSICLGIPRWVFRQRAQMRL